MKSDILWGNIVGHKTLEDSGLVGDLMSVANVHLEDAKERGLLTGSQMGEVYASLIQSAFDKAISFEMSEKMRELEIDNARIKNAADADVAGAVRFDIDAKEYAAQYAKIKVDDAVANIAIKKNKDKRDDLTHKETLVSLEIQHDSQEIGNLDLKSKIRAREEQVIDNRYIKTIEKVGGMLGATMNGGLIPDPSMMETFFTYTAKLNGIRTVNKGSIVGTADNTSLVVHDNTDISYPYGGYQTHDPDQRNDYTSNYYMITETSTAMKKFGHGTGAGQYIEVIAKKGDMIMQSGGDSTNDTTVWLHISNEVVEQT